MSEQTIFTILLVIITADFALERILGFLNAKNAKKPIPEELKGIYDEEQYAKSQEYNRVTTRFGILTATFSFVLLFMALYFGWFGFFSIEWRFNQDSTCGILPFPRQFAAILHFYQLWIHN